MRSPSNRSVSFKPHSGEHKKTQRDTEAACPANSHISPIQLLPELLLLPQQQQQELELQQEHQEVLLLLQQQQQQLLLQQQTPAPTPQEALQEQRARQQQQQEQQQQHQLLLRQTMEAATAANHLDPRRAEPWAFLCIAALGLRRERQAAVCCRFFLKCPLRAANPFVSSSIIVFSDPFRRLPVSPRPATAAAGAAAASAASAAATAAEGRLLLEAAEALGYRCQWRGSLPLSLAAAMLQYQQQQQQLLQQQQGGLKPLQTASILANLLTPTDSDGLTTQATLLGLLAAEQEELSQALQHFAAALSHIKQAFIQQQQQQQQQVEQQQVFLQREKEEEERQQQQQLQQLLLRADFIARHAAACVSLRGSSPEDADSLLLLLQQIQIYNAEIQQAIQDHATAAAAAETAKRRE
ncbi:hypothetical protein Efla_006673 [Eimeria flavescens]